LKKARERAKDATCYASLKGIATSSITYAADDATEASVPIHFSEANEFGDADFIGAYEYGGKSGQGEPEDPTDPITSRWGTSKGKGPATRPLNRYIYKAGFKDYGEDPGPDQINWLNDAQLELEMFQCKSDSGYQGLHYVTWKDGGLTSYDHFGTSYSANIFWVGVVGSGCLMHSNSPYLRPLSRVPNPANTIYYAENVGRFVWLAAPDPCPTDGIAGVCKGWHGRDWTFNVSFADAHAEKVFIKSYYAPELSSYPPTHSGGQGDHFFFHCVIVRGDGWQKDVLPSPNVKTEHECPGGDRPSYEGGQGGGQE